MTQHMRKLKRLARLIEEWYDNPHNKYWLKNLTWISREHERMEDIIDHMASVMIHQAGIVISGVIETRTINMPHWFYLEAKKLKFGVRYNMMLRNKHDIYCAHGYHDTDSVMVKIPEPAPVVNFKAALKAMYGQVEPTGSCWGCGGAIGKGMKLCGTCRSNLR